jgi:hypothetical protein
MAAREAKISAIQAGKAFGKQKTAPGRFRGVREDFEAFGKTLKRPGRL